VTQFLNRFTLTVPAEWNPSFYRLWKK